MVWYLRQSTASQEIPLGPFLDDTDGKTAETALTINNTDIKLQKTGATSQTNKNSGGASHIATGDYYCVLDATDTDTIGPMRVKVHVSGALPVWIDCCVISAAVFDVLFGSTALSTYTGADTSGVTTLLSRIGGALTIFGGRVDANVTHNAGSAITASSGRQEVNTSHWAGTAVGSANIRANITQILGTAPTEGAAGRLAGAFTTFFNVASPTLTTAGIDQTGDAYSLIGPGGSGLTSLGDTRLGNLDATVSSRLATATYVYPPSTGDIDTALTASHGSGSWSGDSAATIWSYGTRELTSAANITSTGTTTYTQTGDAYAVVNDGTHGNAAIKGYVDDIGAAGAGLTAIPWNASWDSEVQSEVDDALVARNIDKLIITSGTADSGTTSTMVDSALNQSDADYWKGRVILFTSGTIAGQCAIITDFNAGTDTVTFAPPTTQAVGTQTYVILPGVSVWDDTLAEHLISGSTGAAMNSASSAGDPWATVLPGSYGANTAGRLIGRSLPDITAGSSGGLLIAGSNAATTFATLTSSGVFSINGTSNVAQTGDSFARIGANGGSLSAIPWNAAWDAEVQSECSDALTAYGTATSANVSAVETDTQDIQSRLPAALVGGRIDANVQATASALTFNLTGNVTGSISGSVGSVTGNVGGNVSGSVGSLATQAKADVQAEAEEALQTYHLDHWIASADPGTVVANSSLFAKLVSKSGTPSFASFDNTTDSMEALRDRGDAAWVTATGFSTLSAAQVNAEVDAALADVGLTSTVTGRIDAAVSTRLAAASYTAPLDAAGVRSAVGLATNNLDAHLSVIGSYLDTEIATIIADLETLKTRLSLARAGYLDNLSSGAVALQSTAAAIETDTQDIQSRIPATLVSGRIDAYVGAMAANTVTAAAFAPDAVTEIQSGLSTLSAAQVNAEVDTALADVGLTSTVTGRIDVAVSTRLASASYTAPLDAAGVRSAIGLPAADLGTRLDAIDDAVDTEVAAIKAKTDLLTADVATWASRALGMIEVDGPVYRYTTNALEQGQSGGGDCDGDGSVEVNHNYGGTGMLAYKTASGVGIDNAVVRIWLSSDYNAGNTGSQYIVAQTTTTVGGLWSRSVYLDPGTYTAVFERQNTHGPDVVQFTVT